MCSATEIVDLTEDDAVDIPIAKFGAGETEDVGEELHSEDEEDDADDDDASSDSLFQRVHLEEFGDHQYGDGGDGYCTLAEALALRMRLRVVGAENFVIETLEKKSITAKKLITAFGIKQPFYMEDAPDNAYYPLVGLCINRELRKRKRLVQYNTIDDVVALLKRSENIVVLTGAGISTSLGIPDFRSRGGLYSQLAHLGLNDPQEVFDIALFKEDPSIFYSVAKEILPSTKKFSPTHAFIRLLQDKDKLLTNYTQNIDNLESHAGIETKNLVQCHGSFATATCLECRHNVQGDVIYDDIKAGQIPRCTRCIRQLREINANGMKRKRAANGTHKPKKREYYEDSTDDDDYEVVLPGIMKPDITFFGEDLPDRFHKRLVEHDLELVDLVVVMGTSLKVAPVSDVSSLIPHYVPQIYISREPCTHVTFDIDLLGDCDVIVAELCRRIGWNLEHEMIPKNQEVDIEVQEGFTSRHALKVKRSLA